MDTVLSEFVRQTGIDPGLGQDLLDAQNWDLQSALKAFRQLSNEDGDARQGSPVMNGEHGGDASSPEVDVIEAPNCVAAAITVADDDEFFANKKLARGISRAVDNVRLVSRARTVVAREIEESAIDSLGKDSPVYTFIIPDITGFADEFRAFLEKDLIETSTLVSLEQGGRLNWWADAGVSQRLYPLVTTGDGNCLLHAASLGMWGFHDRLLTLRKALYATLTNPRFTDAFYRRWRYQQSVQNLQAGLVYCESEWEREWESILKLASTEPRSGTLRKMSASSKTGGAALSPTLESSVTYESLEEFHVFVLAHVLHRSIIVVADTMLKDATALVAEGTNILPRRQRPLPTMDTVLSEFVRQTGIDPGLGQDLLDAQNWDLQSALKAFRQLSNEDGDARQGSPVMNGEHGGDASSPEVDVIDAPNCVAAAITVADDDEFFANKKLARGISRAVDNVRLVSRARTVVAREIEESAIDSLGKDSPVYTFIIPDITGFADEFRAFLEKDLIETSTLVSLEQGGRLNWWADAGNGSQLHVPAVIADVTSPPRSKN
ncbi:PREDICTED: OTU domain-containing protein 7A-like [Priapulus caudatus]|uniref:ubiquitinyl hydrolase 1 n=1 Tax=Priapulus caudatus TaxID=37621 RepID=A0ABM1EEJ3_PRICU|nr:PREDICTED: OTU domain-containing protein 7A-like [Priapulus caudatus]